MNILTNRWIDKLAERIVREQRRYTEPGIKIVGNSNLGYRRIGDTLTFYVASSLQTGAKSDADSAPTYLVYEEENATQIVTSTSMALLDSAESGVDGLYSEQITLAESTGYEFQKDYLIYIMATISSIESHALYSFRIGPEGAVDSANAQAGAAGSITLKSGASATDDLYNGMVVVIIGGTGAGQARTITDYVGSTKVATIEPNWITNPSSSSIYALYHHGRVAVHTDGIAAASIATGAITSAKFAAGAIDAAAIADNAIDAGAIASDAITAAKIATGAIDADAIADNAIDAGAIASGAITSAKFAAGAIDAAAIAADAIGSSELATTAVDEIVDAVWDELTSGHLTIGTFGQALNAIRASTAQAGAATTITLDSGASATDDFYNGALVVLTAGSGAGQARTITDYVGSTKVATVNPAWTTNPSATSQFVILPQGASSDAASIADAVWDEARAGHVAAGSFGEGVASVQGNVTGSVASVVGNVGGNVVGNVNGNVVGTVASVVGNVGGNVVGNVNGNVVGSVGSVVGNVGGDLVGNVQGNVTGSVGSVVGNVGGNVTGSVGSIAAGGIVAASFAANAITAAAVASSAVDEIVDQTWDEALAGHLGAGSTGAALNAASGAPSAAAVADAVWDEARAGHVGAGTFGEGVASVQGNVTGSVASVVGNVGGNVVGSVASVVGNVGGNVVGNVNGNVAGSVGSVVGNVNGNVVGTVASVVGNVGGNVIGSVASVSGNVSGNVNGSVGSVAAGGITAASLAASALTAIENEIWDAQISLHLSAGSTGEALDDASAGGSGSADWTNSEKEQIRQALGVTGATAATTGAGTIEGGIADISGRLPLTLNNGRMRSHVEACDPPCSGGGGTGSGSELEMIPG